MVRSALQRAEVERGGFEDLADGIGLDAQTFHGGGAEEDGRVGAAQDHQRRSFPPVLPDDRVCQISFLSAAIRQSEEPALNGFESESTGQGFWNLTV